MPSHLGRHDETSAFFASTKISKASQACEHSPSYIIDQGSLAGKAQDCPGLPYAAHLCFQKVSTVLLWVIDSFVKESGLHFVFLINKKNLDLHMEVYFSFLINFCLTNGEALDNLGGQ